MKNFIIVVSLLSILNACAIPQSDNACSPLIVKGKLVVDGAIIVPSCGIVIGSTDTQGGAP